MAAGRSSSLNSSAAPSTLCPGRNLRYCPSVTSVTPTWKGFASVTRYLLPFGPMSKVPGGTRVSFMPAELVTSFGSPAAAA